MFRVFDLRLCLLTMISGPWGLFAGELLLGSGAAPLFLKPGFVDVLSVSRRRYPLTVLGFTKYLSYPNCEGHCNLLKDTMVNVTSNPALALP